MKKSIKICIVGKTNNGKTTLINKLLSKKKALSNKSLNFTRDRKYIKYSIDDNLREVLLIDTAGIAGYIDKKNPSMSTKMIEQTLMAIEESDACIFMLDGTTYFSVEELRVIRYIQKNNKDILLVINKSDVKNSCISEKDLLKIGVKNVVLISAEHKINIEKVKDFIDSIYYKYGKKDEEILKLEELQSNNNKIKIAIVGRPNSGKSTFINNLLKSNRLITDDTAGTTRDSIYIDYKIDNEEVCIIDTAGIRKKTNISDDIERDIVEESFHSVDMSNICLVVIDAVAVYENEKIPHQDLAIIKRIIKEGRPFLIIFNKKDLLNKDQIQAVMKMMEEESNFLINEVITKIYYIISAKFDDDVSRIIKIAKDIHLKNSEKFKTSELNVLLLKIKEINMPIISNNIRLKLKFIKQIKSSPHYFMISSNFELKSIPDHIYNYIRKSIQSLLELYNIPIRIIFKKSKNPYAKK